MSVVPKATVPVISRPPAVAAGEITGNGESLQPLRANSECAFSGLDDADDDGFVHTQNWGQLPKAQRDFIRRSASPPRTSATATSTR